MSAFLIVALALSFAAALPATAQQGNSGTIKVHDGPTASPDERNEPHVSGDFYIEGFNMAAEEGTLRIFAAPPTGDGELVIDTTWEEDGGEPANHFLEGPFELPCGHYRVEAQNGMDEDDFPGGVKSKMFWVEGGEGEGEACEPEEPECGEPGAPPCPEEPECGEPGAPPCPPPDCGEPGAPPCPEEPECGEPGAPACPEEPEELTCPTDVEAIANGDGSITLQFTPAAGSDGTNVYRADGDGDFVYLTTVGPDVTTYTDTTTVAGNAYTFMLTGLFGDEESEGCEVTEVSAIPVFPGALGFGLATLLGAGVYLAVNRRRKA